MAFDENIISNFTGKPFMGRKFSLIRGIGLEVQSFGVVLLQDPKLLQNAIKYKFIFFRYKMRKQIHLMFVRYVHIYISYSILMYNFRFR